jgi:hypothetical protein
MKEEEFKRLKDEVEKAKSAAAQARGAFDQLREQLRTEFEVDSIKEAKKLLQSYEARYTKAERLLERAMKEYEKRWKLNT